MILLRIQYVLVNQLPVADFKLFIIRLSCFPVIKTTGCFGHFANAVPKGNNQQVIRRLDKSGGAIEKK